MAEEAYKASPVFHFVAHLLTGLRAEYSLDIARYVTAGYSSEATDYQASLVFLACLVGGFSILWLFIIFVLKLKGREVGCASGHSFERHSPSDDVDQAVSTDLESNESNESNNIQESNRVRQVAKLRNENVPEDADGELSMHSSLPSIESEEEDISCYTEESVALAPPSRRERRAQLCFLVFCNHCLGMLPMILIFSFAPFRHTTEESETYIKMTEDIVIQAQTYMAAVALASNASYSLANKLAYNITQVCPNATMGQSVNGIGASIATLSSNFESVHEELFATIADVQDALNKTDAILADVDTYYTDSSGYLWLIPCVLLFFSIFVGVAMFGVIQAWRNESNKKLQRWLSYGVTPMLVLYSLSAWAMASTLAIVSAMGSDSCLYGSLGDGAPSDMIDALLRYAEVASNSTLNTFLQAYTVSCDQSMPTSMLETIPNDINSLIDYVGQEFSVIQSSSSEELMQACGSQDIQGILQDGSDLVKFLTIVSKSFASTADTLLCTNIRPIYTHVVEESMCTEATGAAAAAFLLFLLLGTSTLVMISLRAAWTQPVPEQKVLKEEDIAENMIVDEHEEYLAYISKYRHEWQEYRGFDSSLPCDPGPDFMERDGSHSENSTGDQSEIRLLETNDAARTQEVFDPYMDWDARSQSIADDISFLSLRSQMKLRKDNSTNTVSMLAPNVMADALEHQGLDQSIEASELILGLSRAPSHGRSGHSRQATNTTLPGNNIGRDLMRDQSMDIRACPANSHPQSKQTVTHSASAEPQRREHFFPSSPKRAVFSPHSRKTSATCGDSRDFHRIKSERILMEMDEIGGNDLIEVEPNHTIISVVEQSETPTSAIAKMHQTNSPMPKRQYGKSVRTSSPRRSQQQQQDSNKFPGRGRSLTNEDFSPSSFAHAPPRIGQYPKAYEVVDDVEESLSPQSTAYSACSSPTELDWNQFLKE